MVDIYSTMRRSGKYLPCRLFLYVTHIGAFVPIKKKRNSVKIKVNFHYIIAEDKKRERWIAAQILISHRLVFCWFFLPWLINKQGIQNIWNFCVECLAYLPVVPIKRKFSFQVCLAMKNVKRGRWLPSWMADTIYQTDFNLNTIQN